MYSAVPLAVLPADQGKSSLPFTGQSWDSVRSIWSTVSSTKVRQQVLKGAGAQGMKEKTKEIVLSHAEGKKAEVKI